MTTAKFNFISDAPGGDQFTVIGFSGQEAISSLYRYQLDIKAPLSAGIALEDMLDNPARFITEMSGDEYPVYGVISSIDELETLQGYVHYRATLVPRLWRLSIYKTNEIYTTEKTVDAIIRLVLENAGLVDGSDFDLGGLATDSLIQRDYRCQFGESDFDFLSRLMEHEGIFFFFEQGDGPVEKIVFANTSDYAPIAQPDLIYEVAAQASRQHDCIDAWSCRKQRLPAGVTVRDYNPVQPSLDISGTVAVDAMGTGTEYLYGENLENESEATYLSGIRSEACLCNQTRYYAESSSPLLTAGYSFTLAQHPNNIYNGIEYLAIEVNHSGEHLDSEGSKNRGESQSRPQYRNSLVAIEAGNQFRPARVTPKPRFFGSMNAFVYAEGGEEVVEMDAEGRYRVHLPFDRADGTKNSSDPNRKASTWIRMAQPSAGVRQGTGFPLKGGTEVLLTFINGDPDRPVITSALPNTSTPALLVAANSTDTILQTTDSMVENIGVSADYLTPKAVLDADIKEIKDLCTEPTDHKDSVPSLRRSINVNGHTRIRSEGSFAIHAQTQAESEDLYWTHNTDFESFGLPSDDEDPYFKDSMFKQDKKYKQPGGIEIFNNEKPIGQDGTSVQLQDAERKLEKVKFEILEDRVLLDTGGRDLSFKCNHYDVDNKSEINNTKGHDHAVHLGSAYEYFRGDSEQHFKGTKREYFHGEAFSESYEDTDITSTYGEFGNLSKNCTSTENFYGLKVENHFGRLRTNHVGNANETFTGHKFELSGPLSEEFNWGNKFEFVGGLQQDIFVGGQLSIDLAAKIDITMGAKAEVDTAVTMKKLQVKLEKKAAKIQSVTAHIVKTPVYLAEIYTILKKGPIEIDLTDLHIM